jgi:hypothetical protein
MFGVEFLNRIFALNAYKLAVAPKTSLSLQLGSVPGLQGTFPDRFKSIFYAF